MGDQLSWLEHLPYKQGVIGSSPISPTISADLAQQVEQLTCNQQVEGSIPLVGTIFMEEQRSGQTRQTVNLFLTVPWFKSMFLHHFILPRSQAVRHETLTLARASSNLAEAAIYYVPLAQSVEHLTFNQRVWSSNLQRDTSQ